MSKETACRAGRLAFLLAACLALSYGTHTTAGRQSTEPAGPPVEAVRLNNLGVGSMNRYDYKDAVEFFRKALTLDPGFEPARVNLGIALFYAQNLDEAGAVLREALAADAKNLFARYTLGLLLKTQGRTEEAAREFALVAEADPDDAECWYNLGILYARLGRNDQAEAAFRRALALQPTNTSAMYNLGMLLLKLGRTEESKTILERFRPLQQVGTERSDLALGIQYGEMGKYALTLDYLPKFRSPAPAPPSEAAAAPFKDVSAEAGLASLPESAPAGGFPEGLRAAADYLARLMEAGRPPYRSASVALSDLDGDGDIDALVTRYRGALRRWQTLVLLNDGRGRFADASASSGIANSGLQACAALGDYDNDGLPDVYLVGPGGDRLYRNLGGGRFADVTERAGVGDGEWGSSATFVDYDHDGDLDLFVCRRGALGGLPPGPLSPAPSANRMLRNNGNGSFTDVTGALGIETVRRTALGMIGSDLDNDRDIDLIVLDEDGPPQIFVNERNDLFVDRSAQLLVGATGTLRSLTVADLDQDGNMDVFLAAGAGRPNLLLRNRGGGSMEADPASRELLQASAGTERCATGALDYDLDGDLDLYVWECGAAGRGTLWRNAGEGRYEYAGRLGTGGAVSAAAADLDGDGRPDIFYVDGSGTPRMLRNTAGTGNRWIGVRLEGVRSNRSGIGAKVEIRAGLLYQKFEIQAHNGSLAQDPPVIWCGLGSAVRADTVTVRWPSGILQSEIDVPAGEVARVTELNRKGTSCPLLYTWNGKGFEFITDFLGGCAIGYLVAPGRYGMPDTDEYVLIRGSQLVPREGKYMVRMANQLEETIMFDRAQLLVVDHPPGTEVYPNEKLVGAPPFPEFRIYTARNPRLPVSAVDGKGNDVLRLIARKDRIYPTGFRLLPFKGYAERHELILDLGPLEDAAKILLLMDAWIDYADSSSNLAASQAGIALEEPCLQVRDRSGRWRTVLPAMGFPAGLPRTMTVDLTGRFLSADHHVRIVTNMRIYWDRIRIDTSRDEPVRVTRLDPAAADLRFLGYPAYYSPDGREPWIYDYSRIRPSDLWLTHAGAYTRHGDVRELLLERDDMYAITRHGDEIALVFDADSVPAPPRGWARDYLLYADGYGKDMDLNSLYPEVIGPLPFHAMSAYPYPANEKYPDDEAHRRYLKEYNTRIYPPAGGGTGRAVSAARP